MRKIEKVYMVTHRYDLPNLFVCLASIKYWYPSIDIVIIVNQNNGNINLDFLKKYYNVSFQYQSTYSYGKFYGSLEPFISGKDERFVIVDTDTAFSGKIIDFVESKAADFIIDYEEQPFDKIKGLYWDPEKIGSIINCYSNKWFTFNNGIMACVGDKLSVSDFTDIMRWEKYKEPAIINSEIFPTFDQSAINVVINKKFTNGEISIAREEIMIYPPQYTGVEDDLLLGIKQRNASEFRVIHWADMKNKSPKPMGNIFDFYSDRFYNELGSFNRRRMKSYLKYLNREGKIKNWMRLRIRKIKSIISK